MVKPISIFILLFLSTQIGAAQAREILTIRKYTSQNAGTIISEFSNFLTLPNVAWLR